MSMDTYFLIGKVKGLTFLAKREVHSITPWGLGRGKNEAEGRSYS